MAGQEDASRARQGPRGQQARIRITRLASHVAPDDPIPQTRESSPSGTSSTASDTGKENTAGRRKARVVVVGGSVLDVHLTRDGAVVGSTVPGRVRFQHGGVGRNIAECLGRLRERPLFVSVVGEDAAGREILNALRSAGVDTRGIKVCPGRTTPVVACTFDGSGGLVSGVADTALVESELDGAWVSGFRRDIERAEVLVLEANLSPEALASCFEIAYHAGVPVFFEPVSVTKSARAAPFLQRIAYLSPNEAELGAIAAASGRSRPLGGGLTEDAALLRSLGVKNVLVTRGSHGVLIARGDGTCQHLPSLGVRVANVNGAGDCLVAGVIRALVGAGNGSLEYAVSYGIAVACEAIQTAGNVPDLVSEEGIEASALQVFSRRREIAT